MLTIPVLENFLWSQAIKITWWALVTIAYSFFKSLFSTPNFFFLYIWAPWQFLDHMTRVLINLRLNNQNRFWTGPEKKKFVMLIICLAKVSFTYFISMLKFNVIHDRGNFVSIIYAWTPIQYREFLPSRIDIQTNTIKTVSELFFQKKKKKKISCTFELLGNF